MSLEVLPRSPRRASALRRLATAGAVAAALLVPMSLGAGAPAEPVPAAQDQPQLRGDWWTRTTPPPGRDLPTSRFYRIRSDLPLEQGRSLADHMDTMYVEYSRRLASLRQRAPQMLDVYMFARQQDYLDTLRTRFGINAMGSGGMFFVSPRGAGLAFFVEGLPRRRIEHVIQHEGFHQFAFSRFGADLPMWVNEGLAEFFGEATVVGRDVVIGQASAGSVQALQAAIESGTTIPFLEMLTMTPAAWNARVQAGNAGLQYQQAWSMVHFLVFGDDRRYQPFFERYLRFINEGIPSEPAFVRAFETNDLDAFERRWKAYASTQRPGAFATAVERLTFLAEGMLELKRRGRTPRDLDELRRMLEEIDFAWTSDHHGYSREFRATDPAMYTVPADDLCREAPTLVLDAPSLRRLTLKERKAEERNPTPMTIATKGLRPRELAVVWRRDEETDRFAYELDAR